MKADVRHIFRSISILALGCIMMFLGGCATTSSYMSPISTQEASITPKSDESVVIFIQPSTYGGAIQSSVFDITDGDNKLVGIISAKTKVPYRTEPGKRMFMVIGESADFLEANLNPDKTYYVLVRPRMGMWKARFSLFPVRKADQTDQKFQGWFTKCKYMTNTGASYQWASESSDSINNKKDKYLPIWKSKSAADRMEATLFEEDGI